MRIRISPDLAENIAPTRQFCIDELAVQWNVEVLFGNQKQPTGKLFEELSAAGRGD